MFPVINFAKLSLPMRISTFRSFFEFSGSARCNPCNSDGNWTRPIVTGNGGQIVCVTSALSCICCLSVRTYIVTTSSDFLTLLQEPNVVRFMFSFRVDFSSSFSFRLLVINVLFDPVSNMARTVSCAVFSFNLTIADCIRMWSLARTA